MGPAIAAELGPLTAAAAAVPAVGPECLLDPSTCIVEGIAGVAGDAGTAVLEAIGTAVWSAFVDLTNAIIGWWIQIDTPGVEGNTALASVETATGPLLGVVLLIGTLIACGMVAVSGRGRPLAQVAMALIGVILVSAVGAKTVDIVVDYSDQLAASILTSNPLDLSDAWIDGAAEGWAATRAGIALMLLTGTLGALAGLVQLGFMLLRIAVIVLFVALLPLAVASASTGWGRIWATRIGAWLLAFIIYKPIAAIIIVAGFGLIESRVGDETGILPVAAGVVLISTSVIALPALLRLVNPLTTAATGVGGGGGAFAAGMAANAAAGMVVGGPKGAAAGAAKGSAQAAGSRSAEPQPDGGK